jgi:DNA replication protein DnaC
MTAADPIDEARLALLPGDLRLPAIKHVWPAFAERADKEGWPAARFLVTLAEHELAERARRRIERHLTEARLPPGKSLDSFDFDAVPMLSKAQVMAMVAGDSWLEKGDNLLVFGPPGGGKSQVSIAVPGSAPRGRERSSWLRRRDRGSSPVPDAPGTGARCRREPGRFGLRRP